MSVVSSVDVNDHIVQVIALRLVSTSVISINTHLSPLLGITIYSTNH